MSACMCTCMCPHMHAYTHAPTQTHTHTHTHATQCIIIAKFAFLISLTSVLLYDLHRAGAAKACTSQLFLLTETNFLHSYTCI